MDSIASLIKYQESVIESLEQENIKWNEGTVGIRIQEQVDQAKQYYQKLMKIQQDVHMIQDKTENLKKRAYKLQKEKEKEALETEQRRQRRQETDKRLSPVIRLDGGSSGSGTPSSTAQHQ